MGLGVDIRNRLAKRASEEIQNGMVVNLGIGIPSLVPNHLPDHLTVMFHAENGIVGMGQSPFPGEEDENLCNAGGFPVTVRAGASYCDSATAFGMIRRGRIDVTILGALQVSQYGDLANWIVPGKKVPGMGGAMELAQKAKKVIVVMNHFDKAGVSKMVESCSLPLTSAKCVHMVITELGVFQITENGFELTEIFATNTIEQIKTAIPCEIKISKTIRQIEY
jgi:acetate CoA/acetoacetate CoA-transferase beta subunit